MPVTIGGGLSFCGRELKPEELDLIRQITRDFSTLSLTELVYCVRSFVTCFPKIFLD